MAQSLCAQSSGSISSPEPPAQPLQQVHPNSPLQPMSSSALFPLSPSFSLPSSPGLPGAHHVLFLSLALAIRFSISFLRPYFCFPCSNCFHLCFQAHLHSDHHLVLLWVNSSFFPRQTSHYNHHLNEIHSDTLWKCMFSIAVPYLQIWRVYFNNALFWIYTFILMAFKTELT